MKNTIIISGFPGIGKSYLTKVFKDTHLIVQDSDSSNFSWLSPGVRNPDFPNNYIQHIKNSIGIADYILVSSHESVRSKLAEEHIEYILVYPDKSSYDEYINRYIQRHSDETFINNIMKTFETFVDQCEHDQYAIKVKLNRGEFLFDILDYITFGMRI